MTEEVVEEKSRVIPPPGDGQRIYEIDPMLGGHKAHLEYRLLLSFLFIKSIREIFARANSEVCFTQLGENRYSRYRELRSLIDQHEGGLDAFSRGYEKLGFTRRYI